MVPGKMTGAELIGLLMLVALAIAIAWWRNSHDTSQRQTGTFETDAVRERVAARHSKPASIREHVTDNRPPTSNQMSLAYASEQWREEFWVRFTGWMDIKLQLICKSSTI
jgi:hypothetical protein